MFLWLTVALAQHLTLPVVVMGNGVVAGSSVERTAGSTVPGGWVPVLADCLEERKKGTFSVVDHAVSGETAKSAQARIPGVAEVKPKFIVITLGAHELGDPKAKSDTLLKELDNLVTEIQRSSKRSQRPTIVLAGIAAPLLAQKSSSKGPLSEVQTALDSRVRSWNTAIERYADKKKEVRFANLHWPTELNKRQMLTVGGEMLSDQGHALVAASVCDSIQPPGP